MNSDDRPPDRQPGHSNKELRVVKVAGRSALKDFIRLPWSLYNVLKNNYTPKGLLCNYRSFTSLEQLKNIGMVIVPIKSSFFYDHCVAVLNVTDTKVTLADPVIGKITISRNQFEKIWRRYGITLKRNII